MGKVSDVTEFKTGMDFAILLVSFLKAEPTGAANKYTIHPPLACCPSLHAYVHMCVHMCCLKIPAWVWELQKRKPWSPGTRFPWPQLLLAVC